MTVSGFLSSFFNPDVISDDHALHDLSRERNISQYENIRHNSIRGKEMFRSMVLSKGPEADGDFTGQHFICKVRAIDTLDDFFTPHPCDENPSFGVNRRKILLSCQQTVISKIPVHHHQRPPRFGDSVNIGYHGDGPNAATSRLREGRYEHKSKLDDSRLACSVYGIESVSSTFPSNSTLLSNLPNQTIGINGIGRWNTNHESPNFPGPFSEVYGCSKEYTYVGNHPKFKGQKIYNGQFPNELLAIPKSGKGGGAGQYKGKTIVAREAVEHYEAMCNQFFKDTKKHLVASGYRPLYNQQKERQRALKKYGSKKGSKAYDKTATPGSSNHGVGIAVDFKNGNINSSSKGWSDPTYHWLVKNAHKYGYFHPDWAAKSGANEPWHWEFKLINKIIKPSESRKDYGKRRRAHERKTGMNCSKMNSKIKV